MSRPAVSLIVHTYNHEPFVDECLDSVSRQTFRDFEVVILDDCSTDGTVERIRAWLPKAPVEVRLVVNPRNLGLCVSRNLALGFCRGEFLSILSGDDYYAPDKIERQYEFFQTLDERVAAVFSQMRAITEDGRELRTFPVGDPPEGHVFDRLIRSNFLPAPAVMTRRSAVESVGRHDESLLFEDWDMWLRLADRYEFRFLPGVLVNYRMLATSVSRSPLFASRMLESSARIMMKWFGRDPRTDRVVLRNAWGFGARALVIDPLRGQQILCMVAEARPTAWRRVGCALSSVPGAGKAVAAFLETRDALERLARPVIGPPYRRLRRRG